MNIKRYAASVIVAFIFAFLFDMIAHGHLIMPLYEATEELWRTTDEMEQFYPLSMTVQFLSVAVLTYLYTRNHEGKGIGEGIRFGVIIGLFVGIGWAGMIAYMPIPVTLAGAWFAASFIQMVGLGFLFSLIYKN